jgi:hypothetical protein
MVQSDGRNVVSLNKYSAVPGTFGSPYVVYQNKIHRSIVINFNQINKKFNIFMIFIISIHLFILMKKTDLFNHLD